MADDPTELTTVVSSASLVLVENALDIQIRVPLIRHYIPDAGDESRH